MSEEEEKNDQRKPFPIAPGLAVIGLLLTGVAGIVIAFVEGSGVPLFASVSAFGLIAWIAFR